MPKRRAVKSKKVSKKTAKKTTRKASPKPSRKPAKKASRTPAKKPAARPAAKGLAGAKAFLELCQRETKLLEGGVRELGKDGEVRQAMALLELIIRGNEVELAKELTDVVANRPGAPGAAESAEAKQAQERVLDTLEQRLSRHRAAVAKLAPVLSRAAQLEDLSPMPDAVNALSPTLFVPVAEMEIETGLPVLRVVAALHPSSHYATIAAQLMLAAGAIDEAERLTSRILDADPRNLSWRLVRARCLAQRGQMEQAAQGLQALIADARGVDDFVAMRAEDFATQLLHAIEAAAPRAE